MKTFHALLALPAVIFLAAPALRAGPGAEYWINRLRPPAQTAAPAKADTTDKKQTPAVCKHSQKCGCAAMATKKAKT
ncbi:MAG: hypothetical protein PHE83_07495 [Opitutaceae bacterium]|nr:hypothetical protein [Opitutaceae bacterium]